MMDRLLVTKRCRLHRVRARLRPLPWCDGVLVAACLGAYGPSSETSLLLAARAVKIAGCAEYCSTLAGCS